MSSNTIEILLVEDNPGDARLTLEAFKEGKVINNLTVVNDGVDALAYLRHQGPHVEAATPDLILLDLNLPRMDGRQVLAEIKADPALMKIPVVVLTTSASQDDITRAYGSHANCYITKPVDLDQFLRVVQSIETFWLSLVKLPGHNRVMLKSSLKVLLVEDNPGDARLLREGLLEIETMRFELSHVDTVTLALERLGQGQFDVGVLDLGLPDARGLEVVRRIHEAAPDLPLLVLTALNDEALAIQSLHEGAQDYLVKAEVDSASLWRALRYAMERHNRQLGLLSLSLIDDLTGLSNRKGFLSLAGHHTKLAYRTGKPFLVGFIDLDGMKQINDTFGHQEGNHALVEAAEVLRDSFRQSDILARYGGDEFAVLISDALEGSATTVIDRLQEKVRLRNLQPGRRYQLSLSVGIVTSDVSQVPDLGELLQQADALMYQHKRDRQLSRRPTRDGNPDSRRVTDPVPAPSIPE